MKKNTQQPTVVFIYGPIAVGKLTTAELLAKKLDYKLAHNHAIIDMVSDVITRNEKDYGKVIEKMRIVFLREVIRVGVNIVVTHCFSYNYINPGTGRPDPQYVQLMKRIFSQAGARVCVVHLKADDKKLLERVTKESRKRFKKLTDLKEMKRLLKEKDWQTSAPIQGQLVIDTTHTTPKQVVNMIVDHFDLRSLI